MGLEHQKTKLKCGCIDHYTYQDACAMGPIQGTERWWTEECTLHGGVLVCKIKMTEEIKKIRGQIVVMTCNIKSMENKLEFAKMKLEELIKLDQ
jgi:hypothetical protein